MSDDACNACDSTHSLVEPFMHSLHEDGERYLLCQYCAADHENCDICGLVFKHTDVCADIGSLVSDAMSVTEKTERQVRNLLGNPPDTGYAHVTCSIKCVVCGTKGNRLGDIMMTVPDRTAHICEKCSVVCQLCHEELGHTPHAVARLHPKCAIKVAHERQQCESRRKRVARPSEPV